MLLLSSYDPPPTFRANTYEYLPTMVYVSKIVNGVKMAIVHIINHYFLP